MVTTINSTELEKDEKLQTIEQPQDPILSTGQSIIDSAITGVSDSRTEVDRLRKEQEDRVKGLQDLQAKTTDKAVFSSQQREIVGLNKERATFDRFTQDLNDINANISGLGREASAIPLQTQERFAGTGATDRGVAPITAGNLRRNAIKALTQASLADIATANINNSAIRYNSALDKANEAVALKYEPIEAEIANLKEQLTLNRDFLVTPAEKRLADRQKTILDEREIKLKEARAEELAVNEIRLEIAKNDPSKVGLLEGVTTIEEAISKAGSGLQSSNNDIIKLDNGETLLVNKRTGKVIKNYGGIDPDTKDKKDKFKKFAITNRMIRENKDDIASSVAEVVANSGAKSNQQMTNAINVIAGVQTLANRHQDGVFKGLAPSFRTFNRFASEEQLQNRSDIEAINLKVQQWASGASLTDAQTEQVDRITPRKGNTDKQVRSKLNALTNYMLTQVKGELSGQGVDLSVLDVDYFAPRADTPDEALQNYYNNPKYTQQIDNAISQFPEMSADDILQVLDL